MSQEPSQDSDPFPSTPPAATPNDVSEKDWKTTALIVWSLVGAVLAAATAMMALTWRDARLPALPSGPDLSFETPRLDFDFPSLESPADRRDRRGAGGVSDAERRTLGGYLDAYAARFAEGGRAVGGDETARLARRSSHEHSVELQGGRDYRVLGACDTDCDDVDLEVLSRDGAVLGSDFLTDDYPVADIRPNRDGPVVVRLIMHACEGDGCAAAARVYEMP